MRNEFETKDFFTALLDDYLKNTPPVNIVTARNYFCPKQGNVEFSKWTVLDIPLSGRKHIFCGSRRNLCEYHLLPGEILCTPAKVWKEPHWDCGHRLLCIVFADKYLRVTFIDHPDGETGKMPVCRKYFHTCQTPSELIRHTLNAFLAAGKSAGEIRLALLHLLLTECRDFLAADSPANPVSKAERTFQLIRQYLLENFQHPLSREETAAHFGLNRSYLSRLFRERCGRGFCEELRRIRMAHAAFLLKNTDCLIDEITVQCGLASTPGFTAAFKKIYGCPPGIFRRK